MPRAFDHTANFFHVPARFLDPNDVGMIRQLDDQLGRHVVSRKRRDVVNEHRQG